MKKSEARRALPRPSLILDMEKSRLALAAHFGKGGPMEKTRENLEQHLAKQERHLGVSVKDGKAVRNPPTKEGDDAERKTVPK